MRKLLTAAAVTLALTLMLTGCFNSGSKNPSDVSGTSVSRQELTPATIYIGMNGNFQEFPIELGGELTPKSLLSSITAFTGWNLDLSDEITTGKGGMTVSFADTSALVVGPPDPQVKEFFVYDSTELIQMILDSVQRTLQQNFVDTELSAPESLDIYFALNGKDINVPDTDIVISHTEPYQGFPAAE